MLKKGRNTDRRRLKPFRPAVGCKTARRAALLTTGTRSVALVAPARRVKRPRVFRADRTTDIMDRPQRRYRPAMDFRMASPAALLTTRTRSAAPLQPARPATAPLVFPLTPP